MAQLQYLNDSRILERIANNAEGMNWLSEMTKGGTPAAPTVPRVPLPTQTPLAPTAAPQQQPAPAAQPALPDNANIEQIKQHLQKNGLPYDAKKKYKVVGGKVKVWEDN